jgi:DHA1 family multidrug resistance protein-like MFS transporter
MVERLRDLLRANHILLWICFITLINQIGFGVVIPVLPFFVQTLGGTEAAVGAAVAAFGLGRLLFDLPMGHLTEHLGRRRVLVIGTAFASVGSLLCGLVGSNQQLLIFRFVAGIGSAAVLVVGPIIVADVSSTENRARMMGVYSTFFQFAVGIGPVIGGAMSASIGPRWPFFTFAILAAMAGVVGLTRLPETRRAIHHGASNQVQPRGAEVLGYLVRNPGFILVGLIGFAATAARTAGIFTVVPATAYRYGGLNPTQVGLAFTIANLLNFATVSAAGVLADRFGRKATIAPGALLVAVSFLLFSFQIGYPIFVLSAIFWGIGSSMYNSPATAYAADLAPPGANGTTLGIYRALGDLGYVLGPIGLGYLADQVSPVVATLTISVLFLVILAPFVVYAPEPKRKVKAVSPL